MSLCVACGSLLDDDAQLCAHHERAVDQAWAERNRRICDAIHRGAPLPRLPEGERDPLAYAVDA